MGGLKQGQLHFMLGRWEGLKILWSAFRGETETKKGYTLWRVWEGLKMPLGTSMVGRWEGLKA